MRTERVDAPSLGESRPPEIPNFELLEYVSAGGFGEVWIARERLTDLRRAIKIMFKGEMARAQREIEGVRTYQRCANRHPHLLQILLVGETPDHYYYVMEAADNRAAATVSRYAPATLRWILDAQGRLDARRATELVQKLTSGVARLHDQGLAHHDLKPENIVLVDGEPKIADVGLVAPRGNTSACTPDYAPGPQGADDVYALGKILYELLSARAAREFPRLPVDLVTQRTGALTRALGVCNRACHPDPARRFCDVSELSDALSLANSSVPGILRRAPRWLRRRDVLLAGGACILACATWTIGEVLDRIRPRIRRITALDLVSGYKLVPREDVRDEKPAFGYVQIGSLVVPADQACRWGLDRALQNFAIDWRIRCDRPWGLLKLEALDTGGLNGFGVQLKGQLGGQGLTLDLFERENGVQQQSRGNYAVGHPLPGVEYIVRLARARSGVGIAAWPLAVPNPTPIVQCFEERFDRRVHLIVASGDTGDEHSASVVLGADIRELTAPLDNITDFAPRQIAGTVVPCRVPELRSPSPQPGDDILAAPWHPGESNAWTPIGAWYWWRQHSAKEGQKEVKVEPCSYEDRIHKQHSPGGRNLLRYEHGRWEDLEVKLRIRLADWSNALNQLHLDPFIERSHSGAVGIVFRMQDLCTSPAACGAAYGVHIFLDPNPEVAPYVEIKRITGFRFMHNREFDELQDCLGSTVLAPPRPISRAVLFAPDGFDLRVSAIGGAIRVFLNDDQDPLVECEDSIPLESGRLALSTWRLIAEFKSFHISVK